MGNCFDKPKRENDCNDHINTGAQILSPFNAEWKFKKADLLPLKDSANEYLTEFLIGKYYYDANIPGLQYNIEVYPNENNEDRRGETWAFLYVNGSKERKITVEFVISIESTNFSKSLDYVYNDYYGWGGRLCKSSELFDSRSKFFVDEVMTIKVKGTFRAPIPTIPKICTPISFEWKIKEAVLKEIVNKGSNDGYLCSGKINVPLCFDFSYCLEICPNKIREDENKTETVLFLLLEMGDEKKIEAIFDVSIVSAQFNRCFKYVFEESYGWGGRLCLTADLFNPSKKYFVDGILTVNFNGVLIAEESRISMLKCKNDFVPEFAITDEDKDFLIIIGDKEIKVHKQLLKDASPVFAGMFQSGMKEEIDNKMIIVDFDFETVEVAINLFYGKTVLEEFSFEDALSLYRFGDKYLCRKIMDLVENQLIELISPSNVVQLIKFSSPDSHNIKGLYQRCIDSLIMYFKNSTPVFGSESLDKKFLPKKIWQIMESSSFNEIVCPFEAEWKFHKADLMHLKDYKTGFLNGKCFYSPNIPGLRYHIQICPNGDASDRDGQTWIFLYVNGSNERKIKAEFSISVEAADFFRDFYYIYEASSGRGRCFCNTLDFFDTTSKFFINGEIIIKVKGTFKAPRPLIPIICTPISFQWKIKESDLKEIINEESNDGYLYSMRINAFHNAGYYLQIYPSRIRDGGIEAHTELFLHLQMGDETKIEASFDFSIDSAGLNCGMSFFYEESYGWGTHFLCSTADLLDPSKGFINDGYLTINLNGILMKQKKQFITLNYKRSLAPKSFNDDKDFLIVVDGKKVLVHKQLLINVSPVFAGMFQSGMKEAIENKMVIVDFPFKIVEAAIKLLYGDRGTCKFILEDLLLLSKFSDKYRIQFIMARFG
uniref:BTB domain-containing protein n=1 Tax=Panagrolaimus davidi TaxID=227884 RepID=A0A914PYZ1_9BILA